MAKQVVDCSVQNGFTCLHRLNTASNCSDFQIRWDFIVKKATIFRLNFLCNFFAKTFTELSISKKKMSQYFYAI